MQGLEAGGGASLWGPGRPLTGHCFSKKLLPLGFQRGSQPQDFHDGAEPR